jgi:hypothetical protein
LTSLQNVSYCSLPAKLQVIFQPSKGSQMLTLTAVAVNVFPTNEFTDKKTGDVTPAGHKVQLQYEEFVLGKGEQESGTKIVLKDFNVHDLGDQYKKVIGKNVSVPVGIMVDQDTRKPTIYIPRGSLPTVQGVYSSEVKSDVKPK